LKIFYLFDDLVIF